MSPRRQHHPVPAPPGPIRTTLRTRTPRPAAQAGRPHTPTGRAGRSGRTPRHPTAHTRPAGHTPPGNVRARPWHSAGRGRSGPPRREARDGIAGTVDELGARLAGVRGADVVLDAHPAGDLVAGAADVDVLAVVAQLAESFDDGRPPPRGVEQVGQGGPGDARSGDQSGGCGNGGSLRTWATRKPSMTMARGGLPAHARPRMLRILPVDTGGRSLDYPARWSARWALYQLSPTGAPSRFQLHVMVGATRT